jgi:hypothetical protein
MMIDFNSYISNCLDPIASTFFPSEDLKDIDEKTQAPALRNLQVLFKTIELNSNQTEERITDLNNWYAFARVQKKLNTKKVKTDQCKKYTFTEFASIFMASVTITSEIKEAIIYKRPYRFIATFNKSNQELEAMAMFSIISGPMCQLKLNWMVTNPKNIVCPTNPEVSVRGAGSSIIAKLINICEEEQVKKIYLVSHLTAHEFYKKVGFTKLENTESQYEINIDAKPNLL